MEQAVPPIRILSVDDHPLMREGIAALIQRHPDLALVGEGCNGIEAIALHQALRPDVTLMDLQMPGADGLHAITTIRAQSPQACILMLTTYKGDAQIWRALKAGAAGYMLKTTLRNDLMEAIRTVHAGGRWIPAEIAAELARHATDERLTEREIEVLQRIASGHSNREVGEQLSVSEETIKARMKNILLKLGAKDRTHAVTIALKRGLIQD